MPFDSFIKIDGIPGETADSKHKGEIEVLSFHWGIKGATPVGGGGGGGAGKAQVSDFTFLKEVGSASPALFVSVCRGEFHRDAVFTAASTAGKGQTFYKVKFSEVLISGVQPGGQGGDRPTEQVSLTFAKVDIEYQDERGGNKMTTCDFEKGPPE